MAYRETNFSASRLCFSQGLPWPLLASDGLCWLPLAYFCFLTLYFGRLWLPSGFFCRPELPKNALRKPAARANHCMRWRAGKIERRPMQGRRKAGSLQSEPRACRSLAEQTPQLKARPCLTDCRWGRLICRLWGLALGRPPKSITAGTQQC